MHHFRKIERRPGPEKGRDSKRTVSREVGGDYLHPDQKQPHPGFTAGNQSMCCAVSGRDKGVHPTPDRRESRTGHSFP